VSNWGVTAIQAALALLTNRENALHDPALDERIIEACNTAGGIDGGITFGTEPAVDGIPISGYSAVTALAQDLVKRALRALS
jgi:chorismate synthase